MNIYHLNIAGYIIEFESGDYDLQPGRKFRYYIVNDQNNINLKINVYKGSGEISSDPVRRFHAPCVEEAGELRIIKDPEFWSIWKDEKGLFIKIRFNEGTEYKQALLRFSLHSNNWDLWIEGPDETVDPLEYPLDGLILYYLTVIHGDIMIHASGINHNGNGYLFSGVSGKGKTTISRIWDNAGAKVIHDDRIIIRCIDGRYRMYNTPVYDNDEPRDSVFGKIYMIEHGKRNMSVRVRDASAVSLVMANCIQHNWGTETISGLLKSVSGMCDKIPVYKMAFTPDETVIHYISENE